MYKRLMTDFPESMYGDLVKEMVSS
jgi:hypothetical protein